MFRILFLQTVIRELITASEGVFGTVYFAAVVDIFAFIFISRMLCIFIFYASPVDCCKAGVALLIDHAKDSLHTNSNVRSVLRMMYPLTAILFVRLEIEPTRRRLL